MKKISYMLSFLALALTVSACGDNGDKTRYCDAGFADGCEDGVYVHCEMEETDSKGRVVESESINFKDVEYICDGRDVLVPKDYECRDGKLFDIANNVSVDGKCNADNLLIFCDGSDLLIGSQGCAGDSMVKCDNGTVVKEACSANKTCLTYERNDMFYATCLDKQNVSGGCAEGVTQYGKCDGNGALTFCSRKDTSKGQTIMLDCPERGQACMFVDDNWGYDCAFTCDGSSYGVDLTTDIGVCKDNKLIYCAKADPDDHDPVIHKGDALIGAPLDCTESSQTCQFDASNGQFDCL